MPNYHEPFALAKGGYPDSVSIEGLYGAPSGKRENWVPDPTQEPMPNPYLKVESVQWYDMESLTPGQFMILELKGAQYGVRRVDDEQMKLWCSRGGRHKQPVPYLGRIANFGFTDTSTYKPPSSIRSNFYPKIVAALDIPNNVIAHIAMPYFHFDEAGNLLQPRDVWLGSVQSIGVGEIQPQQRRVPVPYHGQ